MTLKTGGQCTHMKHLLFECAQSPNKQYRLLQALARTSHRFRLHLLLRKFAEAKQLTFCFPAWQNSPVSSFFLIFLPPPHHYSPRGGVYWFIVHFSAGSQEQEGWPWTMHPGSSPEAGQRRASSQEQERCSAWNISCPGPRKQCRALMPPKTCKGQDPKIWMTLKYILSQALKWSSEALVLVLTRPFPYKSKLSLSVQGSWQAV